MNGLCCYGCYNCVFHLLDECEDKDEDEEAKLNAAVRYLTQVMMHKHM